MMGSEQVSHALLRSERRLRVEVVATHRPMKNEDAISPRRVATICMPMFVSPLPGIHKHDRAWIRSHADFRPRRACDIAARPGPELAVA